MKKCLKINSKKEMMNFAQELASMLQKTDVVALVGDLGSGKTTFAGYLINAKLQQNNHITSPTFNLVNIYKNSENVIWHFDLYRLNSKEEIEEIGLDEALSSAISVIEWPDMIFESLPKETLKIQISEIQHPDNSEMRELNLEFQQTSKWFDHFESNQTM